MNIIYTETLKINLKNIPLKENQLIHCINNGESYYDLSTSVRVETGKISYLELETDKASIYAPKGLYFVKETNMLYKYSGGWIIENTNLSVLFTDNSDPTVLVPGRLKQNGIRISPITLLDTVYDKDGKDLNQILQDLNNDITESSTATVPATVDNQSVFTIPYPFTPYDIIRNIVGVIYHGDLIDPASYTYSSDLSTITLSTDIVKGDHIDFTFIYSTSPKKTNAYCINNMRLFLSRPDVPQVYDVVFNLFQRKIEQFNGKNWVSIGASQSLILKHNIQEITASTSTINVGIDNFDPKEDSLMLFKNNTFLEEDKNDGMGGIWKLSADGSQIIKTDGIWTASKIDPVLFVVLCFKNVPTLNGKLNGLDILDGTIPITALSAEIVNKLNRDFVAQSDLIAAINSVVSSATLNNLNKLSIAVNNDPKFYDTINKGLEGLRNSINDIIDSITNKVNIKVQTIDGQPVDGQTITVVNNVNNDKNTYVLSTGQSILTLPLEKQTSYTVSVDFKTNYVTPDSATFNSGHLGDILNVALMYHK